MAEIPIERKHGRTIWPWILGALALLLLLWLLTRNRGNDDTAARTDSTATATSSAAGTVVGAGTGGTDAAGNAAGGSGMGAGGGAGSTPTITEYVNWVGVVDPNRDETRQHEYTAGGIRRLADALASVGASGAGLDNMRRQADALQNTDASSTKHADMAQSAFRSASELFAGLQGSHPGLDVSRVRSAANAMKSGPHLLDQKEQVQAFFEAAREALHGMGQSTG